MRIFWECLRNPSPSPSPLRGGGTREEKKFRLPSPRRRGAGGEVIRTSGQPNPLTPFPAREGGTREEKKFRLPSPRRRGAGGEVIRTSGQPNPLTPFPAREGGTREEEGRTREKAPAPLSSQERGWGRGQIFLNKKGTIYLIIKPK